MATIALDSNVAVALLASQASGADELRERVAGSLDRESRFVLPLGCVGEIWRAATEPPPGLSVPPHEVSEFLALWASRGGILLPGSGFMGIARELLDRIQPLGAAVFDVLIAAVCIEHGVDEIWTLDARFPRDPRLNVVDPLG